MQLHLSHFLWFQWQKFTVQSGAVQLHSKKSEKTEDHDQFMECLPAHPFEMMTSPILQIARSWKACHTARAFPTAILRMLRTWRSFGVYVGYSIVLLLTWVPIIVAAFMLITLLSDPFLFVNILWQCLQWPTCSVRDRLAPTSMSSPPTVPSPRFFPMPSTPITTGSSLSFMPSTGPPVDDSLSHPASALIVSSATVVEGWAEWAMRYCFAGQVGAAAYWAITRAK